MKRLLRRQARAPAARPATTSTPTSPRATTRGTSASASSPTATCSRPSGRARPRWSPTTSTPSPRRASGSGRAPSSTPTSSSPPPAWSCSSSAASSCRSTARPVDVANRLAYKGMMLEGVPNLAIAVGYTNASWTLKCDLTCDYVCRLLNHMRARPACASARPSTATPRSPREPLLGLNSGYVQRSAHRFPEAGLEVPVAGAPELPARLPGPEDEQDRGPRHGVLQPRPRGRAGELGRRLRSRPVVKTFDGRVAAITGAGSGIGRALAIGTGRPGRPPGPVPTSTTPAWPRPSSLCEGPGSRSPRSGSTSPTARPCTTGPTRSWRTTAGST